jgi:hypothetical protein
MCLALFLSYVTTPVAFLILYNVESNDFLNFLLKFGVFHFMPTKYTLLVSYDY